METHETRFRRRMRREIERLKAQVEGLEGQEREDQLLLIAMLERDHAPVKDEEVLQLLEQEKAWGALVTILNEIEQQVTDLEHTLVTEQTRVDSKDEAQRIVDQFSYDCQEAEKLMKLFERRGQITPEQRTHLETQLRTQVETMITLFRRSEYLTDAVMRSFTAQLLSV